MSTRFRSVKGTRDLLPPETAVWNAVEACARRVFESYGYGEVRTPLLEDTGLFERGVGESSDIVGKEMYSFEDRKGRRVSLRPESTAAVGRAFIQHNLQELPPPVRLFYIGPHFRYERPQKGRYRQFHQIGAELLGDPGPHSDAEVILMLVEFLRQLEFRDLAVLVNTVGDEESRASFRAALVAYLEPHRERLGEDSRRRLETNPLRILDTKDPAERELLEAAPTLADHLSPASREHFDQVLAILERFEVPFEVAPRLVRGLDYYTKTVFEIVSKGLGSHDAVVGAGRYDGLIAELGGPPVEGIGFAIGQDRLIDVLPESFLAAVAGEPPVMLIPIGEEARVEGLAMAEALRAEGVAVVAELSGRSMRAALKQANRRGVRYVALVGEEEIASGELTLRDLESGEQETLSAAQAARRLKEQR